MLGQGRDINDTYTIPDKFGKYRASLKNSAVFILPRFSTIHGKRGATKVPWTGRTQNMGCGASSESANRRVACSELVYRDVLFSETLPEGFKHPVNKAYVLMEDFTVVFSIEGKLYVDTVPKGYLSNGVTGAPFFDDVDPRSWYLHDWHYGTHQTHPKFPIVDAADLDKVVAAQESRPMTWQESDSIFHTKYAKKALELADALFGDVFWKSAIGQSFVRAELADAKAVPEGSTVKRLPAEKLERVDLVGKAFTKYSNGAAYKMSK